MATLKRFAEAVVFTVRLIVVLPFALVMLALLKLQLTQEHFLLWFRDRREP
jgi:hypothetical protein